MAHRSLLNKENDGTLEANVLDLTIKIDPRESVANTTLFDKGRAFNLDVVNFPDLSACIPSRMAYGIIPSQLLRYYKSYTTTDDLKSNCYIMFQKVLSQSYARSNIVNKVKSFSKKHLFEVTKYGCNKKDLIDILLSSIPRSITVTGRP